MKAFLDTTVLVATFYADHQHHDASIALFLKQKTSTGCTAAHCLTEFYAVATAMPGRRRANPHEALLYLRDVRERLFLVALGPEEFTGMLEKSAALGVSGATVYDALIAECVLKSGAHTIFTWNVKHFHLLGSVVASRVRHP